MARGTSRSYYPILSTWGSSQRLDRLLRLKVEARVAEAVDTANALIRDIAAVRGLPLIDQNRLTQLTLAPELSVGGYDILPSGSGPHPRNLFVDRVHLGTVGQGLFANAFIEAINRAYSANVVPLSDQEILLNAESASGVDLPVDNSTATYFDISDFVLLPPPAGDVNLDGLVDVRDIDAIGLAVRDGLTDDIYDLNRSGTTDGNDHAYLIRDVFQTWYGDANLDREFSSGDMVQVFAQGKYETGDDASWSEGDWNGDGIFDSSDMVTAFADGGYEKGLRADAVAVPEPWGGLLLTIAVIAAAVTLCRKRDYFPRLRLSSRKYGCVDIQEGMTAGSITCSRHSGGRQ